MKVVPFCYPLIITSLCMTIILKVGDIVQQLYGIDTVLPGLFAVSTCYLNSVFKLPTEK